MEKTQRKTSESIPENLKSISLEFKDFDPNGSQSMTLPAQYGKLSIEEKMSSILSGYHLTVRFLRETTSRKELSLLLEVLCYQSVHFGISLNMQIAMFEIYFRLLGSKLDSLHVSEGKIRTTLCVAEILFKELEGIELSLSTENRYKFDNSVCQIVSKGLMNKRTYGSRYRTYRPEAFLRVLAVPVNILYFERRQFSKRYTSYCKGYGESHPSARFRSKTRISSELDGDGSSWIDSEENQLFKVCTDKDHVLSNFIEISYRNWRLEKEI